MNKGFTLIELLVVVLIIGILSSVALPQYQKSVMKARMAAAIPIAKTIRDNLAMFHATNGSYPTNAEFPDMVTFGEKTCNTSGQCRVGNYLVGYASISPLVAVLYSPGTDLANISQTEKIGAGVVTDANTNNIPALACVAGGTKATQICKSSYTDVYHSLSSGFTGTVRFYKM